MLEALTDRELVRMTRTSGLPRPARKRLSTFFQEFDHADSTNLLGTFLRLVAADTEDALHGATRGVIKQPYKLHPLRMLDVYIALSPTPTTNVEMRVDAEIAAGILGHDNFETRQGRLIKDIERKTRRDVGPHRRAEIRGNILGAWHESARTDLLRERLKLPEAERPKKSLALSAIDNTLILYDKLTRERGRTEYGGENIFWYVKHVYNIFHSKYQVRNKRAENEHCFQAGIVKLLDRADIISRDLYPVEEYLPPELADAVAVFHPSRLRNASGALRHAAETDSGRYESLTAAYHKECTDALERLERWGSVLFSGERRLQNLAKTWITINEATRTLATRNKTRAWTIETFTKVLDHAAVAFAVASEREVARLLAYEPAVSVEYANYVEDIVSEYFDLPQSKVYTNETELSVPAHLSEVHSVSKVWKRIMAGDRPLLEMIHRDVPRQYLHAMAFLTISEVYTHNIGKPGKEREYLRGDLLSSD